MKLTYKIKVVTFLLINAISFSGSYAQTAVPASTMDVGSNIPTNTMLCCIALVLLFIIIILATTVNGAIELYKNNNKDNADNSTKKVLFLVGFLLLTPYVFSQNSAAAKDVVEKATANAADTLSNIYFYCFITVIIVEVAIILFFIKSLRFLTGIEQLKTEKTARGASKTWWETINQFKPLDAEDNMDTGHNYDGIRELDNITPPWFTVSFIASIVFAIIYLYRFNISGSIPHQEDELAVEMRQAQALQDSLVKLEGNKIDENSVVMLTATDIADGHKIYAANCAPCHGDKGQGAVGPNLTDDYWLHGGSIKDVFKTIKYGYVDKGMKAWKDDFSPKQIAQLSSFIKSLKGTNPVGAKERQGELYVEAAIASADKSAVDSTQTK